jgi:hypothetical protein
VNASWEVRVPGLEMTVAQVVAHAAHGPPWYALDLWSGPGDDAAFEVSVKPDARNAAILLSVSIVELPRFGGHLIMGRDPPLAGAGRRPRGHLRLDRGVVQP